MDTAQKHQSVFPTAPTKTIDKGCISKGRNSSKAPASNGGKQWVGADPEISQKWSWNLVTSTKKKLRTLWSFFDCADMLHFPFSYSKCSLLTARTGSTIRKCVSQVSFLCVCGIEASGRISKVVLCIVNGPTVRPGFLLPVWWWKFGPLKLRLRKWVRDEFLMFSWE